MNLEAAFEVLGVTSADEEKTVRRAYAKLAKQYRPDSHPEEFSRVREAYELVLEAVQSSGYEELNVARVAATVTDSSSEATESLNEINVKDLVEEQQTYQRAVSYVVNAEELGSTEDDIPATNPIQHMEDEVVAAVKATLPGDIDSENRTALLIDEYLLAASRVSHGLRDYVERFVVGLCLGDYYLPHVVREKAGDLCGLSNAVVSEQRLKPWEQEFLRRFDESSVVENILVKAAQKGQAEKAVLSNLSWPKIFMLRLNESEANKVDQYVHWFDYTFGKDAGYVSDGFRYRWRRMQQVEPLNAITIVVFTALMGLSGVVLHKLGVPIIRTSQIPKESVAFMVAGLAVLSWANFLLLVLARPVVGHYQSRVRDVLNRRFGKALLVIETVLLLGLIWLSVLAGADESVWVTVFGVLVLLVGCLSRNWDLLRRMPFSKILMLFARYLVVASMAYQLLGSSMDASSAWLVMGLAVTVLPNRSLFILPGGTPSDRQVVVRGFGPRFSLQWLRVGMAVVAIGCSVGVIAMYHFMGGSVEWPRQVLSGLLLSLLGLELALNGFVGSKETAADVMRSRVFDGVLVLGLVSLFLGSYINPAVVIPMLLAFYLVFCAEWVLSPKRLGGN